MHTLYDAILCLNGEIPPINFWNTQPLPLARYACDGAGLKLHQMGVQLTLVLGDGDSLTESLTERPFPFQCLPNQDATDFDKTLNFLKEQQHRKILVTGLHGKEIDHTLQNIATFVHHSQKLMLHFYDHLGATAKWGFAAYPGTRKLQLTQAQTISILPYPEAVVSSQGLVWELNHSSLSLLEHSSARNRSLASVITLTVHTGVVLVVLEEQPRPPGII